MCLGYLPKGLRVSYENEKKYSTPRKKDLKLLEALIKMGVAGNWFGVVVGT